VATFRAAQDNLFREGIFGPRLHLGLTLQARASLASNKSAGGGEAIVAEILCALPFQVVLKVHEAFAARYEGIAVEEVMSWRTLVLMLIPKERRTVLLAKHRGISLLSVFSKWYMAILTEMCKASVAERMTAQWRTVCCYGFEERHSVEQVLLALNILLQKAREWRGILEVHVFGGDVLSAFDNLTPEAVAETMTFWGLHPKLVAAVLAELKSMQCWPTLGDVELQAPTIFNKCIRQGGKESTWLWNATMRRLVAPLHREWVTWGWGIDLPGFGCLTHLLWADNIYLVGANQAQCHSMAQMLTAALETAGLAWKPSSLAHLGSNAVPGAVAYELCSTHEILAVPTVESMEVLGCDLQSTGETSKMMDRRLASGTAAFWANKHSFLNKQLSLRHRFSEYQRRVLPAALFGCGTWTWARSAVAKVSHWENGLLRRMLASGRAPGEGFVEHIKRTTRKAHHLRASWGFETAATKMLRAVHRLAGQVAWANDSGATHVPSTLKILPAIFRWRSAEWWRTCQAIAAGEHTQGWRHASPGRVCNQWETVLVTAYGEQWTHLAGQETWRGTFEQLQSRAFKWIGKSVRGEQRPRTNPRGITDEGHAKKKVRICEPLWVRWEEASPSRAWIGGDSKLVIDWLLGRYRIRYHAYRVLVSNILKTVHRFTNEETLVTTASKAGELFQHVFREHNSDADSLAGAGHSQRLNVSIDSPRGPYYRVQFDGSRLENGATAIGFKVWTRMSKPVDRLESNSWTVAAVGGGQVNADSVVQTELMACTAALATTLLLVEGADPEMAVERLADGPRDISGFTVWWKETFGC